MAPPQEAKLPWESSGNWSYSAAALRDAPPWGAAELERLEENANLVSRCEERASTAKLPEDTTQRPEVYKAAKESVSQE